MFSNTILTSWAGCPQSRLYHEVVAHGDRDAARLLTQVARQWDHTMAPAWIGRLVPRRLHPAPFDAAAYRTVVSCVSLEGLRETMEHVTWLRGNARVRSSLGCVAFLEAFEGVVADEMERRLERLENRAAAAAERLPNGLRCPPDG